MIRIFLRWEDSRGVDVSQPRNRNGFVLHFLEDDFDWKSRIAVGFLVVCPSAGQLFSIGNCLLGQETSVVPRDKNSFA